MDLRNPVYSRLTYIFLGLLLVSGIFTFRPWEKERFIDGDGFGYYAYLPALFIEKDLTLSFMDKRPESYFHHLWYSVSPIGIKFTKMGAGVAFLQLPFFLTGHALAHAGAGKPDGFSLPYRLSLVCSSVFYGLIALWILRKFLLKYLHDRIVALTMLVITLATNVYHYTVVDPLMSHSYGYFLFIMVLSSTVGFYENPSLRRALKISLWVALIVLVRPSNVLVILLPIFYGIRNTRDLPDRLRFLRGKVGWILICAGFFLSLYYIQTLYWKTVTGEWFYYAYRHERFYFFQAHIWEGLFGFRKGWLLYFPVLLFGLGGILFLKKRFPEFFLPFIFYFPLNIWVVLSWWCWWYGGSYGLRAFMESHAFLTLPMGLFFQEAWRQSKRIKTIFVCTLFVFSGLTVFQFFQYQKGILHYDGMTRKAYGKIFMRLQYPVGYDEFIQTPDYESAIKGLPERVEK